MEDGSHCVSGTADAGCGGNTDDSDSNDELLFSASLSLGKITLNANSRIVIPSMDLLSIHRQV